MIRLDQNNLQMSIVSKEKVAGLEKYGRMNLAILDLESARRRVAS